MLLMPMTGVPAPSASTGTICQAVSSASKTGAAAGGLAASAKPNSAAMPEGVGARNSCESPIRRLNRASASASSRAARSESPPSAKKLSSGATTSRLRTPRQISSNSDASSGLWRAAAGSMANARSGVAAGAAAMAGATPERGVKGSSERRCDSRAALASSTRR